eukprot:2250549-Pyramimonas_sp.AAC.2
MGDVSPRAAFYGFWCGAEAAFGNLGVDVLVRNRLVTCNQLFPCMGICNPSKSMRVCPLAVCDSSHWNLEIFVYWISREHDAEHFGFSVGSTSKGLRPKRLVGSPCQVHMAGSSQRGRVEDTVPTVDDALFKLNAYAPIALTKVLPKPKSYQTHALLS